MDAKRIWIIDEGSQGHVVQSRGLVRELAKFVPVEVSEFKARLTVPDGLAKSMVKRLLHRFRWRWLLAGTHRIDPLPEESPDLIVASGPRSLLALEYFAKTRGCPSVFVQGTIHVPKGVVDVIMRPPGDSPREDKIFIPLLFTEITPETLAAERAAWQEHTGNQLPPLRALFIGQSSAKIRFRESDWQHLTDFVNAAWKTDGIRWLVTTSYRTGIEREKFLQQRIDPQALHDAVWYSQAPRKVTREFLARADRVFVTMDSLTMMSEAVSSGKPVVAIRPESFVSDPHDSHHRYLAGLEASELIRISTLQKAADAGPESPHHPVDFAPAIRDLLGKLAWDMTDQGTIHLGVSHSPLTTLVFRAAMADRHIPGDAIRSFTRRSVEVLGKGVQLDELSDRMQAAYKKWDRKGYQRLKSEFHRHLDELTAGRRFLAYLPHTRQIVYQETLSHPRCEGYLFLEEGFTSMAWSTGWGETPPFMKRLLNRLRGAMVGSAYRFSRPLFDIASPGFRGAFAISKQAFSGMSGRHDVSSSLAPLKPADGHRRIFVILDTSYLHRGIRWDDYCRELVDAVRRLQPDGFAAILVKFHFADSLRVKRFEEIRRTLEDLPGVTTSLLPPEISVEETLRSGDAVVFGVSSLGYYAALMGARVVCFAPQVTGISLDRWIAQRLLPVDFPEITGTPHP